jgi:hypothetical protein
VATTQSHQAAPAQAARAGIRQYHRSPARHPAATTS